MWQKNRAAITEIAPFLSTEKFYSTVAKMQKKRVTTPKLWASFTPQNRQEVQIPANFAVKSWEDQIFGARRRCHRTTDKDHAIPVKQGFQPCFFLAFRRPPFLFIKFCRRVYASKAHTKVAPRPNVSAVWWNATFTGRPAPPLPRMRVRSTRPGNGLEPRVFRQHRHFRNILPEGHQRALTCVATRYLKSGMNCGMESMP